MPVGDDVPYNRAVLRWWLVFLLASSAALGGWASDALLTSSHTISRVPTPEPSQSSPDEDSDPCDEDSSGSDEGDERDDVGALRSGLVFSPSESVDGEGHLCSTRSFQTAALGPFLAFGTLIFRPPIRG